MAMPVPNGADRHRREFNLLPALSFANDRAYTPTCHTENSMDAILDILVLLSISLSFIWTGASIIYYYLKMEREWRDK
jgi:hypothetical protein